MSEQDEGAEAVEPHLAAAIVDVFVYVVVLNLFVEYLPVVISETFTLSLLTALLLPVMLMVVFVYLFGGAVSIGTAYVDYVAPGVLLLCAVTGAAGPRPS